MKKILNELLVSYPVVKSSKEILSNLQIKNKILLNSRI